MVSLFRPDRFRALQGRAAAIIAEFLHSNPGALRVIFATTMLVASALAGLFGVSRWLTDLPEGMTQIRVFTTIAAVIAFLPELRRNYRALLFWPFLSFAALCGYMLLRGGVGGGELALPRSIDLLFLVVQAALIVLAAQIRLARRTAAFVTVLCALCLFPIILQPLLNFKSTLRTGFGWGGAVGSITFNRITFLGFCVIFCIYPWIRKSILIRLAMLLLCILLLFGTWGSLQKAAVVGSFLVTVGMLAAYVVRKRWEMALFVFGVSAVAIIAAGAVFFASLSGRFSVLDGTDAGGARSSEVIIDPDAWRAKTGEAVPDGTTAAGLSSFITFKLRYCYFKSAVSKDWTPGAPLRCYEPLFVDRTSRLALWLEAVRGVILRPVVGNGLGSYKVLFIHPEKLTVDEYKYPHNVYLEIAFEGGAIGLMLLFIAIGVALRGAWRTAAPSVVFVPVMGFACYIALSMLFAGNFYDSRFFWLSLMLLAGWRDELPLPQGGGNEPRAI